MQIRIATLFGCGPALAALALGPAHASAPAQYVRVIVNRSVPPAGEVPILSVPLAWTDSTPPAPAGTALHLQAALRVKTLPSYRQSTANYCSSYQYRLDFQPTGAQGGPSTLTLPQLDFCTGGPGYSNPVLSQSFTYNLEFTVPAGFDFAASSFYNLVLSGTAPDPASPPITSYGDVVKLSGYIHYKPAPPTPAPEPAAFGLLLAGAALLRLRRR